MPEYAEISVYVTGFLLVTGAAFMLLAAVGILRLPDLPTRMHASTKAGALGASLTMLAVAVLIPELVTVTRALAVITFILLTAPVAAHVIGRAGYSVGVPLWEGTVRDDLQGHYDPKTHALSSGFDDSDDENEEPGPVVIEDVDEIEGAEPVIEDVAEDEDEDQKKNMSPDPEYLEPLEDSSETIEGEG